jgi:Ca2+-binding RTX toxin-like protein
MVPRLGGGVFVAYTSGYPNTNKMIVWRIGDSDSKVVDSTSQGWFYAPTIASAPGGRLWVVWGANDGRIHATVSNANGTAWSPVVSTAAPSDAALASPYNLGVDATDSGVDVVANYPITNGVAYFHTQFRTPPEWTAGDDTLVGTGAADFIYGGPGNDTLKGAGGKDELYGGNGNDKLNGGPGKDKLNGGKGTDTCIFTKGDKMSGCEKKKRAH